MWTKCYAALLNCCSNETYFSKSSSLSHVQIRYHLLSFIHRVDGNSIAGEELTRLVMMLLENYDDTLCVLQLEYYPKMLQLFDYQGRKQLAVHLATTIVEKYMYITTPDAVSGI